MLIRKEPSKWTPISDFRISDPDFRFRISGFRISDFGFPISDFGFRISIYLYLVNDAQQYLLGTVSQ